MSEIYNENPESMKEAPKREKESGVRRVVGVDSADEVAVLDRFEELFLKQEAAHNEKEKSAELEALIRDIDKQLNEFLRQYGAAPLKIEPQNIHVIDRSRLSADEADFLRRKSTTAALFLPRRQSIIMLLDYESQKLKFAQKLVHEMVHATSFQSFQRVREKSKVRPEKPQGDILEAIPLYPRRVGIDIRSPGGNHHFRDLNEAVTVELARRFDWKYFSQFPELAAAYREREQTIASLPPDEQEEAKFVIARVVHEDNGDVVMYSWTYDKERHRLVKLIHELYKKNQSEFSSPEEVFSLIATAAMNGRLLPFARLVEKTFGKGSFREIGIDDAHETEPQKQEST